MGKSFRKKSIAVSALLLTTFAAASVAAKRQKPSSVYADEPDMQNPFEGKRVVFVEDENDQENADGVKGRLEATGLAECTSDIYEKYIKRGIDIFLSFGGLVALSPVMGAIALAIKIEDPGPALFTQKRVGRNKQYFKFHKFRSMKMDTPHDVPTHMLDDPDRYITRVGRFLRAHSLDELPQIWDIFTGNMSIIGPRPALWNQDLLTAERDLYGANDIKPGLTGLAQISGRDELTIEEKARLDGQYRMKLGPKTDAKVFLRSIRVFAGDEDIAEGGRNGVSTDERSNEHLPSEELPTIAHCDPNIDMSESKRILIVGQNSYIGTRFKEYMSRFDNYVIDTVSSRDPEDLKNGASLEDDAEIKSWRDTDLSGYDAVYDVAGLAHVRETGQNRELYYRVNRDLALEIAEKAKEEGVRNFIYLSSMSVYGVNVGSIDADTLPHPRSAYGKSKLEAEMLLWQLADENFKVSIVRPPMVYGPGCKGNYQKLRKFVLEFGIFPEYYNQRSMISIENMSAVVRGIIHNETSGLYFPQDPEYVCTYDMVRRIADEEGMTLKLIRHMSPIIKAMSGRIGLCEKVFGSLMYERGMNVPGKWYGDADA